MKRRITALFLALALLCAILPTALFTVSAEEMSGTCGENLTWSFDEATGVLTISGSGAMENYEWPTGPWHIFCERIKTVILPDGMTSIGDSAFIACSSLTSVTIPDNVTSIGINAFSACSRLTDVTIPDSVTNIGASAFHNCSSLKNVTISDCVTSVGAYAFSGCSGLTSATIGNGVTSLNGGVFSDCSSLKSVMIGNNVKSIAENAFFRCTSLANVTIPDSVTSISNAAFSGCRSLKSVTIPNSVTSIGESAFYQCGALTEVTIPDSITSISDWMFSWCTGLKSVMIPDSVTSIGAGAFYYCGALKSVTIPDSVTSIGGQAFFDCAKLENLTIGNSVASIGSYAFSGCSALPSVAIPLSVTRIGEGAFNHTNLETFFYQGTEEQWENIDISCVFSPQAMIHYGVTDVKSHCHLEASTTETCTEAGTESYSCACGFEWVQITTQPLGHNYVDGICSRCGKKDPIYIIHVEDQFTDIKRSDWFYYAVNYAVLNNLYNGMGNKFEPNTAMNRAMLVTVLWRYAGSPKEGTNTFTDVKDGQWYTDAVAWASSNSIVGGVGGGKFDPNGNVTREQLAAILFRYCDYKEIGTDKRGDLSTFPDKAKVSAWAANAYSWAVGEGLIGGNKINGQTLLDPQGNATRAQVATILMRFIENVVK